jgi:predicted acylesterase/phospholipase RssA
VPAHIRLEEVKSLARVNYAIAKLISGGTENLQTSFTAIKSVKDEFMKSLEESRIFPVTEIRLQALTDILAAMGFSEDLSSLKNDLLFSKMDFPQVETEILVKNIKKVLIGSNKISHCEPVFFSEESDKDEFVLLDQVLSGILRLDRVKFAKNVCQQYYNHTEPATSQIKEIMRKENHGNIRAWKTEFLKRKVSLTFQYLPLVSVLYNLIFLPCIVKPHRDHKRVFVPTGESLDFSNGLAKISVYVLIEQQNTPEDIKLIKGIFVISETALLYLHHQLINTTDRKVTFKILNQIAFYHRQQAEKNDRAHNLEALQQWNTAKEFYDRSLKVNSEHATAMLGYARCLIMLSKYKAAQEFLVENAVSNEYFREAPERWFLLAIAERKLQNYDEAKIAIEKALQLQKNCHRAKHELRLILKLQRETVAERIELYKKTSLAHGEPNGEHYNILSIDGGGIRGLIPAIWLSELERRTQMSASSMFHVMAGTSTGGIIAAGLSIPHTLGMRRPRHRAVDLVELYSEKSGRVFSRSSFFGNFLGLGSKYTDEGRKGLCKEYCGDTKLSEALTDLLITSASSSSITTELFRRSEGLTNPKMDHKIIDVLMCTSAAPTYFPAYRFNDTIHVDGGVQANNPAMLAYSDACSRQISHERICLVSLGTGDFVLEPLNPDKKRHLLFWLTHISGVMKVIFDGPQNNISAQLSNILESDKYHRWQTLLPRPIKLDAIKKETLDFLKEHARAYFDEMEASDSSHRLGKLIERLKDQ